MVYITASSETIGILRSLRRVGSDTQKGSFRDSSEGL